MYISEALLCKTVKTCSVHIFDLFKSLLQVKLCSCHIMPSVSWPLTVKNVKLKWTYTADSEWSWWLCCFTVLSGQCYTWLVVTSMLIEISHCSLRHFWNEELMRKCIIITQYHYKTDRHRTVTDSDAVVVDGETLVSFFLLRTSYGSVRFWRAPSTFGALDDNKMKD